MEAGRAFAPQVFVAQFEEIFRVRGDSMALPGQATPVGNVLKIVRDETQLAPQPSVFAAWSEATTARGSRLNGGNRRSGRP